MKILAIIGSYRKNGNTARIVRLIEADMRERAFVKKMPLEFETIFLGHQDIAMCRGCRVCFDKGEAKCPLKDDFLTVKAQLQAADAVILTTPVYVNDVSGTVKNFIDRLAHVCHRPEFAGKSAYLIATVGLGPTRHALRTMNMALSSWGYHIEGQAGFKMGALMEKEALEAAFMRRIEEIAESFFNAIYQQKAACPSFLSLMTFRIQQGYWWREPDPGSVDYGYWVSRDWVNRDREFYTVHRAGWLKVFLARLAGAMLEPFVT